MDEERFPKSVSLGDRAVAWVESEVQEWILERVSASHRGSHYGVKDSCF